MERMEQSKKEKEDFEKGYAEHQQKMNEIKQKLKEADLSSDKDAKTKLSELEDQEKKWREKEEELKKKEKLTPLNIDTICHDGKSKTVINKPIPKKELTEEEKSQKHKEFVEKHKADAKKFGMLRRFEDSQQFLIDNPDLVCEETANVLVIWCIDLAMEEKTDLMNHVAHQTIVMNFIMELAKQMDVDPRSCVRPFFSRIKLGEKQYMEAFNSELDAFKERITKRAQEKLQKAMEEYEEEERQKRLGPGGLDPVEVFETLPEVLQKCFESKDIASLQKAITELPEEEARYHMKRCVDSGLWVPEANKEPEGAKEEEVYDEVQESEPLVGNDINDVD
ncbi:hsp90 co-chaperone Cdc37-like isoform X2 [Ostrea edulis]|nr:hsp90 co-chaperone Cdc37-like isoform X2 [Ostrea edulis]